MLVLAGISRLLDTCLSGMHNANNIVNSIMCAVMSSGIHDMHGTGTKNIVLHSQKSGVQWSGVDEFNCNNFNVDNYDYCASLVVANIS